MKIIWIFIGKIWLFPISWKNPNFFFKSKKRIFFSELENFSDMYSDSELHALSNGAIFRAIRALLHAVWERSKKFTDLRTTFATIQKNHCYIHLRTYGRSLCCSEQIWACVPPELKIGKNIFLSAASSQGSEKNLVSVLHLWMVEPGAGSLWKTRSESASWLSEVKIEVVFRGPRRSLPRCWSLLAPSAPTMPCGAGSSRYDWYFVWDIFNPHL